MSDAEKSVDDVRRIERLLKAETGLRVIASTDAEVRSKSYTNEQGHVKS